MQCSYTTLSYSRYSSQLVSSLRVNECDGVDAGVSAEALAADLFEHSVQKSRRES